MSRLSEAAAKLESAVDRIEAAVIRASAAADPEIDTPASDQDGDDLRDTLDEVRQENAALKQSVGNAQLRLDHAIDRIRTMLGE